MELTKNSPEFIAWLEGCQKIVNKNYQDHFPNVAIPILTVEEGRKLIKINKGSSVYCFVAKVDYQTKELGSVKCGDVLKAASWKKPAKHARGNLLNDLKGLEQMNSYGAAYLRG